MGEEVMDKFGSSDAKHPSRHKYLPTISPNPCGCFPWNPPCLFNRRKPERFPAEVIIRARNSPPSPRQARLTWQTGAPAAIRLTGTIRRWWCSIVSQPEPSGGYDENARGAAQWSHSTGHFRPLDGAVIAGFQNGRLAAVEAALARMRVNPAAVPATTMIPGTIGGPRRAGRKGGWADLTRWDARGLFLDAHCRHDKILDGDLMSRFDGLLRLAEPLSISATAAVILLGDGHLASSRALSSLGGDISGNGISKLFLTIAAAFAEAERDRIRERSGQGKADQRANGRISAGGSPMATGWETRANSSPTRPSKGRSARWSP